MWNTNIHSVHLTDFPKVDIQSINHELSQHMNQVKTIVSLWLSWRARKKIRVRQPLKSIIIGFELDEHFNEIIRDELNIKEIIIDESINEKVTKICKPDARRIWPKYGKDVQEIIRLGKLWQFEEIEEWWSKKVKIAHWILQEDEYVFDYIQTDESLDIQASDGIVISIDPEITPELESEGYVRDLIRSIQEARKEAGYNIEDRIQLTINSQSLQLEQKFADYIQEETLSTLQESIPDPDSEKTIELGGEKIIFGIKK